MSLNRKFLSKQYCISEGRRAASIRLKPIPPKHFTMVQSKWWGTAYIDMKRALNRKGDQHGRG